MAREKIVGFRVSDELHKRLHEMSIEKNTSISDVLREIVMDNLDMSYQYSSWEIHAWNYFGINADQLNYAKRVAKAPEVFFSIISKWSKEILIRVIAHTELTIVEFRRRDKHYLIQESKVLPKIQVIQSIVDQLVKKLELEVTDEAKSLCDWSTGRDISSASKEQHDESPVNLSKSVGSEGYTDMSDLNDLGLEKRSEVSKGDKLVD